MKIGQVILMDNWYGGEDLYSDGPVEEEMQRIAADVPREACNREIAARGSYAVLYHFSQVRENILRWLPFTGREKVLEIGSGCGAVTGALCELAGQVDAVELSMKRSRINALRNRDHGNLTIYVGNFEEIEGHLPSSYDVITLIGVFEYAKGYIHSDSPYSDLLSVAASHLKPGGMILLAIENRFGLKYWAGCTEDHTGVLFDGLEGYRGNSYVSTFTRKELSRLIESAGDFTVSWYYPFPDYKFPLSLYSDRYLPRPGELKEGNVNYDRLRLRLFEEDSVADSLIENRLFPEFSNSFLCVIRKKGSLKEESEAEGQEEIRKGSEEEIRKGSQEETWKGTQDRIQDCLLPVYARFSNERSVSYQTMTTIYDLGIIGERLVRKKACNVRSKGHILSLSEKYMALRETLAPFGFRPVECLERREREGVIFFPFVEGETLEQRLDSLLLAGQKEKAAEELIRYAKVVHQAHSREEFRMTAEFEEVFGKTVFPEGTMAAGVCDIDLIPSNIILPEFTGFHGKEGPPCGVILDYEWTFFFPVPADYVVFRFLWYYLQTDPKRQVLSPKEIYAKIGLTQRNISLFQDMERSFQKYILKDFVPMRLMYDTISPGQLPVWQYYQAVSKDRMPRFLQVFYDRGKGYSEEDSVRYKLEGEKLTLAIPEGLIRLRLDPGEEPLLAQALSLVWDSGEKAGWISNGFILDEDTLYFPDRDPQIWIEDLPPQARSLTFRLKILPIETLTDLLSGKLLPLQKRNREELAHLQAELAGQREKAREWEEKAAASQAQLSAAQEKIRQMEGTKVWRFYRRLRRLLRKP